MSEDYERFIDAMRHGEPVGGKKIRGQQDDPLSLLGWQQMRDAVRDSCPWQRIITSPLARCRAFAEELSVHHGVDLVIDERIQELRFGAWEGLSHDEVNQQVFDGYVRFWRDVDFDRPVGSESIEEFSARVVAAWQRILEQFPRERLLLVCHAGVVRMLLCHVLGAPPTSGYRIHVPYASLTRFRTISKASGFAVHVHHHGPPNWRP